MALLKSIKGKLLLIVVGSLILMAVSALTTTKRLNSDIASYDEVIHGTLRAQKYALSANLEFKRQVQE